MSRQSQQTTVTLNLDDTSSNDSESNDDSDDSLEHRTASDVINSFLNLNKTVNHKNIPKSRTASDVINSFLQKNKIVDQASDSQFDSALDVINSFLRRDKFAKNGTSCGTPFFHKEITEEISDGSTSTSESDLVLVSSKRKRKITESTSDTDSDSSADGNTAKKQRIENSISDEIIGEQLPSQANVILSEEDTSCSGNNPITNSADCRSHQLELQGTVDENIEHNDDDSLNCNRQSTTVPPTPSTLNRNSRGQKGSSKGETKAKSSLRRKQKDGSKMLKVSFTREVFSRQMNRRRTVEREMIIKGEIYINCYI